MKEKSQNIGTRQNICRIRTSNVLVLPPPIAWKKTGIISENTAGIKPVPIMRKATFPISYTSAFDEKMLIRNRGKKQKQTIPITMNTADMAKETFIVSRHRRYSFLV